MVDCREALSVAARTIHFVDLILTNTNRKVSDFRTFKEFVKFLDDNEIRRSVGFNKNKYAYMDTLDYIWHLNLKRRY